MKTTLGSKYFLQAQIFESIRANEVKSISNLRVQHRFGGMRDEAKNLGGMWNTRNFKGGMRDENRTARPGYASFRRRDTG